MNARQAVISLALGRHALFAVVLSLLAVVGGERAQVGAGAVEEASVNVEQLG